MIASRGGQAEQAAAEMRVVLREREEMLAMTRRDLEKAKAEVEERDARLAQLEGEASGWIGTYPAQSRTCLRDYLGRQAGTYMSNVSLVCCAAGWGLTGESALASALAAAKCKQPQPTCTCWEPACTALRVPVCPLPPGMHTKCWPRPLPMQVQPALPAPGRSNPQATHAGAEQLALRQLRRPPTGFP